MPGVVVVVQWPHVRCHNGKEVVATTAVGRPGVVQFNGGNFESRWPDGVVVQAARSNNATSPLSPNEDARDAQHGGDLKKMQISG